MKAIELNKGRIAIIDDEDFEVIAQYRWWVSCGGYACRKVKMGRKWAQVFMHHWILPRKEGFHHDHKNGNRLDNRKCNLRYATDVQNACNVSLRKTSKTKLKGVDIYKGKWRARITINRKTINLGYFTSPHEAHSAYLVKAKELHGEFHRHN